VRAFIVWEPVLPTDWGAPSTATLKRIFDPRARQYWDKRRLVSHAMGERGRSSIFWDYVGIYSPQATWNDRPPQPLYAGSPVVRVREPLRETLARALAHAD
jgi:hypothetical protein